MSTLGVSPERKLKGILWTSWVFMKQCLPGTHPTELWKHLVRRGCSSPAEKGPYFTQHFRSLRRMGPMPSSLPCSPVILGRVRFRDAWRALTFHSAVLRALPELRVHRYQAPSLWHKHCLTCFSKELPERAAPGEDRGKQLSQAQEPTIPGVNEGSSASWGPRCSAHS